MLVSWDFKGFRRDVANCASYHLFLLTEHKCALTSVFLETCSPVNILGHIRCNETHTVYISYNPFYAISSLYWFPPLNPTIHHTSYS